MTLTITSDRPPRRQSAVRRYTPDENALIVDMLAAGATPADIAARLGRSVDGVRFHARTLAIQVDPHRAAASSAARDTVTHCHRCGVLLARAPAGRGAVCGWCEREKHT